MSLLFHLDFDLVQGYSQTILIGCRYDVRSSIALIRGGMRGGSQIHFLCRGEAIGER